MTSTRTPKVAPIERRALRINDAALAYGVGRSTLYKLMSEGKLATVKVAGRRLVPCDNMEALLALAKISDPLKSSSEAAAT
jgi:excisionase family DNA binding protein